MRESLVMQVGIAAAVPIVDGHRSERFPGGPAPDTVWPCKAIGPGEP